MLCYFVCCTPDIVSTTNATILLVYIHNSSLLPPSGQNKKDQILFQIKKIQIQIQKLYLCAAIKENCCTFKKTK